MAAVQFPNPNATNPETNAPYSDGWTADNGVTYIYEDNAWKAQSVPGESADSRYVEVAGDNMTGNLTLGTDKITLDAADGSATFNGNVGIGTSTPGNLLEVSSETNAYIRSTNSAVGISGIIGAEENSFDIGTTSVHPMNFYTAGVNRAALDTSGNLTLNTDKIALNADGSATFAGAGKFDTYTQTPYSVIGGSEYPSYTNPGISIRNEAGKETGLLGTDAWMVGGNLPSSPNILLQNTGSATFAGLVQLGGDPSLAQLGTLLQPQGIVAACRDGNKPIWYGFQEGTATETSVIQADGGARFNGFVEFRGGTSGVTGRAIELNGDIGIQLEPDDPANYTTTTEEYEEQEEVTPYVPGTPATYDEYGNELTAEIPAVEATYQTVTKTREISTYNGPTLDVKERLTKADTALQTLKTAAAAAVDFASLQAAIATALADI